MEMKVIDLIRNALFAAAAVILAAAAVMLVFRWQPAVVMSDSMKPAYGAGSLILIDRNASYGIGDPIAFHTGGVFVTHRLVDEEDGMLVTKGDNNQSEDTARITREDVTGKVILWIPNLGYTLRFLSSRTGLTLSGAIVICLVLSMFISHGGGDGSDGSFQ